MEKDFRKMERIDRLFDIAEQGRTLEIKDLKTCLGIVAYDREKKIMFGAHILNVSPDAVMSFIETIPENRRARCSYLTFGCIPMPEEITGELSESNLWRENNYYSVLIESLNVIKEEGSDEIIYRDSNHFSQLREYSNAKLWGSPDTGEVVLFGQRSGKDEYEQIEKVILQ